MPRHPTLGIKGSKPRFLPSITQMMKAAEAPEPKPAKAKRQAAKAKRRR
jgi:hypothetical protein